MRNLLFTLIVLLAAIGFAKADDGMHGGWCPTDGYVYDLYWLPSWTCEVNGDSSICMQDYECVQTYMLCRVEKAPRLIDREPMEVDNRRNA